MLNFRRNLNELHYFSIIIGIITFISSIFLLDKDQNILR